MLDPSGAEHPVLVQGDGLCLGEVLAIGIAAAEDDLQFRADGGGERTDAHPDGSLGSCFEGRPGNQFAAVGSFHGGIDRLVAGKIDGKTTVDGNAFRAEDGLGQLDGLPVFAAEGELDQRGGVVDAHDRYGILADILCLAPQRECAAGGVAVIGIGLLDLHVVDGGANHDGRILPFGAGQLVVVWIQEIPVRSTVGNGGFALGVTGRDIVNGKETIVHILVRSGGSVKNGECVIQLPDNVHVVDGGSFGVGPGGRQDFVGKGRDIGRITFLRGAAREHQQDGEEGEKLVHSLQDDFSAAIVLPGRDSSRSCTGQEGEVCLERQVLDIRIFIFFLFIHNLQR